MNELGAAIQNIRIASGVTQSNFARLLKMAPLTIQKVESGAASIRTVLNLVESIIRHQKEFKIESDELVTLTSSLRGREEARKALEAENKHRLFSDDLIYIRERILGVNQKTMSAYIGVTQASISQWESKETPLRQLQAEKYVDLATAHIAENGLSREDAKIDLFNRLEKNRLL